MSADSEEEYEEDSCDMMAEESAPARTRGGSQAMGRTTNDSFRRGGSPSITVVALSSCQAANGSFPRSSTLTSLFGAALETNPSVEWSTALAVAWFEERCQGQRDEWELVVDKARRWLVAQGMGGMVDQARSVLQGKVCALGHAMQMIQRKPGELWHCDSLGGCQGKAQGDSDHAGIQSWRCAEDMRVRNGGTCNYDICEACVKSN